MNGRSETESPTRAFKSAVFGRERAQDMIEYGLLIATVAIVLLVGVSTFGQRMLAWFQVLAGVITTSGVS